MNTKKQNQEQLKRLAQAMFNQGREEIEEEIKTKVNALINDCVKTHSIYTSRIFREGAELHTERIRRLLELKLCVDREIFLGNQPIKSESEMQLLFEPLPKIANAQVEAILNPIERYLPTTDERRKFREAVRRKVEQIINKIYRRLEIEKDKNIYLKKIDLKKEEAQKEPSIPQVLKELEALLKSIEDEKLKEILWRDIRDAYTCIRKKLWKPCVALCGGIIEGVLGVEFSIKGKFEDKIEEAVKRKIISEDIGGKLADVVRLLRNYIHIEKEIKKDGSIDRNDASLSFNIITKIFYQIERYKKKQAEKT